MAPQEACAGRGRKKESDLIQPLQGWPSSQEQSAVICLRFFWGGVDTLPAGPCDNRTVFVMRVSVTSWAGMVVSLFSRFCRDRQSLQNIYKISGNGPCPR